MDEIRGLMDFIDRSPTAFHAIDNISSELTRAGFEGLLERDIWTLRPGGRYFFTRNQSSVIAFRIPEKGFAHAQIVASHSDSPCFKLKPNAHSDRCGCAMLDVERYGGVLLSTWLDRPLGVAGRVIARVDGMLESRLVDLKRPVALIPNVPIHFNRTVNENQSWNVQVDMMPLCGEAGERLDGRIAEAAGVSPDDVAGADLYLYNCDRAKLFGVEDAFIAAPRLDDLECAYASMRAFLTAESSEHLDILCVFDNEEVGSGSKQGADSTLLTDALHRIADALGAPLQAYEAAMASSFMLSADNAHALHPNHPEKYDAENQVFMNRGVVVKSNASLKYTSDAVSLAVFETLCAREEVPVQRFSNRSDLPGGSTLGHIANAHASMNTVDIGLPQLAMHSACETAGARDLEPMIRAMRRFYETEIMVCRDGLIELR